MQLWDDTVEQTTHLNSSLLFSCAVHNGRNKRLMHYGHKERIGKRVRIQLDEGRLRRPNYNYGKDGRVGTCVDDGKGWAQVQFDDDKR